MLKTYAEPLGCLAVEGNVATTFALISVWGVKRN
jgi:hypothetical protein